MDSQHSQERNRLSYQTKPSPDRVSNDIKDKSPLGNVKEMKDMILASSKSIIGRVLSPTKEKLQNIKSSFESKPHSKDLNENNSNKSNVINKEMLSKDLKKESVVKQDVKNDNKTPAQAMGVTVREAWPVKLMTRKQLTDPFGSDEEDEQITVQVDERQYYSLV